MTFMHRVVWFPIDCIQAIIGAMNSVVKQGLGPNQRIWLVVTSALTSVLTIHEVAQVGYQYHYVLGPDNGSNEYREKDINALIDLLHGHPNRFRGYGSIDLIQGSIVATMLVQNLELLKNIWCDAKKEPRKKHHALYPLIIAIIQITYLMWMYELLQDNYKSNVPEVTEFMSEDQKLLYANGHQNFVVPALFYSAGVGTAVALSYLPQVQVVTGRLAEIIDRWNNYPNTIVGMKFGSDTRNPQDYVYESEDEDEFEFDNELEPVDEDEIKDLVMDGDTSTVYISKNNRASRISILQFTWAKQLWAKILNRHSPLLPPSTPVVPAINAINVNSKPVYKRKRNVHRELELLQEVIGEVQIAILEGFAGMAPRDDKRFLLSKLLSGAT